MAISPIPRRNPSARVLLVAAGISVTLTAALIALTFVLGKSSAPSAPSTSGVDLTGIPQREGVLGDPAASVRLIEYADLQCPACRYYSGEVFPTLVDEYVRSGQVAMDFRGFAFLGPDSTKAMRFVLAAGRQNLLWQLQEALFRYQGEENEGWVTDSLIRERAAEIAGLDAERLFADARTDAVARQVEDAAAHAHAEGVPGTPTFFVQIGDGDPYFIQVGLDLRQFRAALDDALAD